MSGAQILAHPLQKKHYDTNVIKVTRTFGISPQEYRQDGLIDNTEFGKGKLKLEIIEFPGIRLMEFVCTLSRKVFDLRRPNLQSKYRSCRSPWW